MTSPRRNRLLAHRDKVRACIPTSCHERHEPTLTLDDVKRIARLGGSQALANRWAVSIAIVDGNGHLLWLQRLDGAAPISAQIAPNKARTRSAAASRAYEEMINQGGVSFLSAGPGGAAGRRRVHRCRGPMHRRGGRRAA